MVRKKTIRYGISLVISMLFFSSAGCFAQETKTTEAFGSIEKIANLNRARAAHSATRLLDGKVVIIGGMERNGVFYDEAEVFDPTKNTFTKLPNKMIKKRVSHSATLLKDGRVLIVGGWSNRKTPENTVEIYDPKTRKFTSIENTKFRRSGHSSTLLENGKVLIAGGNDGSSNLSEAELFDPDTNSFSSIGNMQSPRKLHVATKLEDGRVLFTGGERKRGEIVSDAEIFDPKRERFSTVSSSMNDIRYKHDAVLLSDGNVLIFGGSDERDTRGKLKSAEIFDPEKETFTPTGEMNFARFKIRQTATLLKSGKVLIAGGNEEAEIFDPKTRSFSSVSGNFGKSLHFASVTLLSDGRALILGGYEFIKGGEPTSTKQAWIFRIST